MVEKVDRPDEESVEAVQESLLVNNCQSTPSECASLLGGVRSLALPGYAAAAGLYRAAGWRGVLPLPPGKKFPPPRGFTGHDGAWPHDAQIAHWVNTEPDDANLMLRVNYGVVGIDVDAYDAKTGGRTLQEAESRWGPLPATYRSSARGEDAVSGIRLFRVPEGALFRGVLKFDELGIGDIEIVQPHHRFVVAWPSINPQNGARYRWYAMDGSVMPEGQVPNADELPELPPDWLEGLSRDAVREAVFDGSSPGRTSVLRSQINEQEYERLIALEDDGPPDEAVEARLTRAVADLTGGTGSRYDTTRDHVLALVRMSTSGHTGVPSALGHLFKVYVEAVSDTRPPPVAESEFLRFARGAAALVAAMPVSSDDAEASEDAFWAQREILGHIRAFAQSRGVAPYAVLGAVLRRAITLVPPWVQLPPTVADVASVNLFTVSVGRSGQGKDAANGVGRAAVVFVDVEGDSINDPPSAVGVGSGEGLAKALRPSDDQPVPQVNLEVQEVGTLGALASRQGATVIGELLKAYMGQPLGFTNARQETTSFVSAHSYRLCLGVGVQPENAGVLMDREKDGLPQRFLWLPTTDPYAPAPSDDRDVAVPAARLVLPTFRTVVENAAFLVQIPAVAGTAIREHRHRVVIGDPDIDTLDGHLMLTRLKVGFGLALLDSRDHINEDDWRIAGQLIEISNRERATLRQVMVDQAKRANIARAQAQADREEILSDRQSEHIKKRVRKSILKKLKQVKSASRSDLRRGCDSTIRQDFDAAFGELLDEGVLLPQIIQGRSVYALSGS